MRQKVCRVRDVEQGVVHMKTVVMMMMVRATKVMVMVRATKVARQEMTNKVLST